LEIILNALLRHQRLPLEAQLRLRQVEDQAKTLNRDELQACLIATHYGWQVERQRLLELLADHGIEVLIRHQGYLPHELLGRQQQVHP
jgi:hypothetical protein